MLAIISPSKKLQMESKVVTQHATTPPFLNQTEQLITTLKTLSQEEIASLMSLSDKLAELNYQRYHQFNTPFNTDNATAAIFAFKGDVYDGLDAETLTKQDIDYAQKHIRILSGLYGIMRPLDLMQAYRLEMGTKLKTQHAKNLYEFWSEKVTHSLNKACEAAGVNYILNLASNEYSKVVDQKTLSVPVLNVLFKEKRGDNYKMLMLYAKRARGMMARFITQQQVTTVDDVKQFSMDGYAFNAALSTDSAFCFTRG